MTARIVLAVVIGGGIGLAIGSVGKSLGGTCPIACNPYVSTAVGIVVALLLASHTDSAVPKEASANLVVVESDPAYEGAIAGSSGLTLVEFYTTHCPWCRKQMPVMSRLADDYAGRATIAVVDASSAGKAAGAHNVTGVPQLILFLDGQVAERLRPGYHDEADLRAVLDRFLAEQGGPSAPPTASPT